MRSEPFAERQPRYLVTSFAVSAAVLAMSIVVLVLSAEPAEAATAYTSTSGSGNWSDPSKWTPNGVPGSAAGDSVSILCCSITMDYNMPNALVGFSNSNTLTFAAGGNLRLGAGTHTNSGTMNVTAGALTVSGTTLTFPPGSNLTVSNTTVSGLSGIIDCNSCNATIGGTTVNLNDVTVNNTGTIVFSTSGTMNMGGGAIINNNSGGIFDVRSNGNIHWVSNPQVIFNNNAGATFRKTTTAGTTSLTGGTILNNAGTVEAQIGTIQIPVGTSSGTFAATLPQTIDFASASHSVNGATVLGNGVRLNGGTITGTGGITIPLGATMTWSSGTMSGSGTTTVASGGTLLITGAVFLNERIIDNFGTVTFSSAGGTFNFGVGATFNNKPAGVFDAQNSVDTSIHWISNPQTNFNNEGLFKKTTTAGGVTRFTGGILFNNSGTVESQIGTIEVRGGTSTGTFQSTPPASVDFDSATHTMNGAFIAGTGVRLNGGSINGTALSILNGAALTWSSGTMTGVATDVTNILAGGTLKITGAVSHNARQINNSGTVIFNSAGGTFNMGVGAVFNNNNGGTFDDQNTVDASIHWVSNPQVFFNNAGLLVKTAGPTATTRFTGGTLLNNTGTVQAQTGTLEIRGGTSTGVFTATLPAVVAFDSATHNMNGGSVAGNGVTLNGGTIAGPTFLIPAGAVMTWSSGTMGGVTTDATNIANGGTLKIIGAVSHSARQINNSGTVIFNSAGGTYNMGVGAIFTNNNGGVFDDQNTVDANIHWVSNPQVFFNNAGILKKTAGPAATLRFTGGTLLNNTGTVDAQIGTIAVRGGTSTGLFTAVSPAIVEFDNVTHTMNGGSVGGNGVRLNGGTIAGPSFIVPSGATLNWLSGTMGGVAGDTTTVNAGGTVIINGTVSLSARTFDNNGLVTFASNGTTFNFGVAAIFNNNAGGVFDAQNAADTSLFWVTNPAVQFNNAGLVKKTTTAGGKTVFSGVPLNNSGTVDAQVGTIDVRTGTSTGAFTTAAGAMIAFTSGTHTLNGGATLNGPGIRLAGATLTGTGITIASGGTLTWTSGLMDGPGQTTTVNPGGTMVIAGTAQLNERTFSNNGTVIFSSGVFNLGVSAIFNNNAGGLFDDQNTVNDQIVWTTNPIVQFNNAGTFRKSATAGTMTTLNSVPFNNTGTVDAQAGTIRFFGGTSSGTFNTAAGAFISFVSGTHTLSAGNSLTGAGSVLLAGGSISAPAGVNVNGGTLGGAGTITGNVINNANVAPGASPGLLTISGNYTQAPGAALNIELAGTSPGSGYDRLAVSGTATLAGTLNVTLFGGYTPAGGETYSPLTFASRSGDFATKNLPTFGSGGSFTSAYTATALTLTAIVTTADLGLTQTAPASVSQGQNVVYTITVTNGPSINATNVVVSDTFSGASFVSVSPSAGTCTGTGPITCNLGTLPVNGSATVTLTLNANTAGPISSTASVTANEADPNLANNSATTNVTVNPSSDLSIVKTVSGAVVAGQTVVYNIAVKNNGPSAASGVIVSDPTPAGLTFVSNSGACTTPFPCTIAAIGAGVTTTITSTFFVPSNAGGTLTNVATVSHASDGNSANNTSSVATTILQKADLEITKSGPASAAPGSTIEYTIIVRNNGPSDAHDITVTDPTPAQLTRTSVTGACTTFPCSLGSLTAGQIATMTARFSSSGSGGGTVSNTASVTTSTSDPTSTNNSATATTVLSCTNEAPGFVQPENGKTGVPTSGRLSWQGVNATLYSINLAPVSQGGCNVPFASTSNAFHDYFGLLPNTTYAWKVIAVTFGCPDRETACATFTTAANCNATVTLVKPLGGTASSPVEFEWQPVTGATEYSVFVKIGSGNFTEIGKSSSTKLTAAITTDGTVQWYVVATIPGCGNVQSATATFTLCSRPATPLARVVGESTSAKTYNVEWDAVPNAIRYEVDEATNANFTDAVTTSTDKTSVAFKHDATTTPLAFYYRVRAFSACTQTASDNSPTIRIVIIPLANPNEQNPNTNIPAGSTELVVQRVFIPGETNQPAFFTAVTDRPWLAVRPPNGVLPPEGVTLEVIADPGNLPNGTFTATVIVTITTPGTAGITGHGTSTTSKPISISLVTPVTPVQNKLAPSADSLIIPSVGHLDGINSHWQSDIRVTNTSAVSSKYALTFTPSAGTASGIKQTTITVGGGETTALDDIIKNWFGIGSLGDSANGMLEIRSADNTPLTAVASSRTYNVTSNGTLGQYIPALPFGGFIGRALQNAAPTILSMQQISQSSAYRTNVGIVEASGQSAAVILSVFNAAGLKLTDIPVNLAGGEQKQLNSILAANNITLNDGRVEVKVTGGDGKVTAYASVVDNKTNDPLLVSGVATNQLGSPKYVLPGVADLTNTLASWRTDMRIFNTSLASHTANLTLHLLGGGTPLTASVSLQPGEVRNLDDVVKSIFKVSDVGGAVHVATTSQANLVVTGRTYNQTTDGTYGQFIEAVTPERAVGAGGRTLHVLQVEDSVRYRTNLGIAEVSGAPATVEVQVILPDSKVTPTLTFTMAPNEFRQLGIVRDLNLGNVYNARLSVRVTSGQGRVTAYGSVIDMTTQDPTYVPAQ